MSSSAPVPRTVSREEFALLTARPETRILFCVVITFALGAVRGFRNAWPVSAVALTVGGVLAVVGMLSFVRAISTVAGTAERAHAGFSGILPYLYGLYLFGYEGLWGVRSFLHQFTLLQLIATLLFVYLGYRVVYWTWQLTEIADALRTGKLRVSA